VTGLKRKKHSYGEASSGLSLISSADCRY